MAQDAPAPENGYRENVGNENGLLVNWDGLNHLDNPMNWPNSKKWTIIALFSFSTFNVSMASSIFAPAVPQVMLEFHSTDSELSTFMISVFVIGFIFGPLVLSPTSEVYGRVPVTHASNATFFISAILCATSVDVTMLIVFRLLMGLSGCLPVTLGGAIIADLMPIEKRGTSFAIWAVGPLVGPSIGPIIGGYVTIALGWRWTFWLIAMLGGSAMLAGFLCMRETYAPVILKRKARNRQREAIHHPVPNSEEGKSIKTLIATSLMRPARMLISSPILLVLSLYLSLVYSYFYLFLTTFTEVFEKHYGFNSGEAGLAYLGLGVGCCVGQFTVGPFSDHYLQKQKNIRGHFRPEDRLPPMVLGSFLVPSGLLWYGWSAEAATHWIVPIIGTGVFAIGLEFTFLPIQMYLIDTYTIHSASALAANTVVRSLFATCVPLAGNELYQSLGLGWGSSCLAFIAILFAPLSLVLVKYGERLRTDATFV